MIESLRQDLRDTIRSLRRSPQYAAGVAATMGLGLGVLCSAFTLVNAYILRPIDLPEPRALYELSWDSESARRQRFRLADVDALRENMAPLAAVTAGQVVTAMREGSALSGLLVTGNYFQLLGAQAALGRVLTPADAAAPGSAPVAVLSAMAWRIHFGADPNVVGQRIVLGSRQFEIVGVMPPHSGLAGQEFVTFWAPLTMAAAFQTQDPRTDAATASLFVITRLRRGVTDAQASAWLSVWLRQRFTAAGESPPVAVHVESRATRIPWNRATLTLFALLVGAFALVLLVACANVTNLMLARAVSRRQEIGIRLALGAARLRVARQCVVESLVLGVPAAAIGLALTFVIARVFPTLIVETFPTGIVPLDPVMVPLDPDLRVVTGLAVATILAAVVVSLAPAIWTTSGDFVQAARGDVSLDGARSRLRAALVAVQVGACVLFIVGASGLVSQARRLANPDAGISYERVVDVRTPDPALRAALATRLASDPTIELVAAAWDRPLSGPLGSIAVRESAAGVAQMVGFAVVSPEYFPLFDIRIVRGRNFTASEADARSPVVLVSRATAQKLWPGADPVGQTLRLLPMAGGRPERRPDYTEVHVIGVTEDVANGTLLDGVEESCVYFATGFEATGEAAVLVRGRGEPSTTKEAVTAAVDSIAPGAPFRVFAMRELVAGVAWMFEAFSVAAAAVGTIGLLLAFSGTYAVVSFVVAQRRREFGVRLALGASAAHIVGGVMIDAFRIASVGTAVGLGVTIAVARAVGSLSEVVPSIGLSSYALGLVVVLTAVAAAALLPSLRTRRIDPAIALQAQ